MSRFRSPERGAQAATVRHGEASGKVAAPPAAIQYPIRDLGLEKPKVDMAFIPILCSAPLLYAKTHGYFARNGLDVTLTPAPGWSGVKDLLAFGHTDAAHMLSPMPLAIRQGLDGRRAEIRLACIQNVNGQALTLAKKHAGIKDAREMKGFTFGVPYRFSMHYYLLCLFLAEHGLDPLRDVNIVEISPPRMPYFIETGRVDGVFAPEPFNQIPVYRGTGFIYTLSKEIWQGHPCCCFASTEEFISKHPKTYKAMLRSVLEAELALHRALPDERREVAAELSQPGILNQSDPEPVAQALSGEYDDGMGRQCIDHDRMDFLPTPWPEYGGWILSQQQRWKQLCRRVDYREVVEGCFDAATREVAKALGFEEPGPNLEGIKTFRVSRPLRLHAVATFLGVRGAGRNGTSANRAAHCEAKRLAGGRRRRAWIAQHRSPGGRRLRRAGTTGRRLVQEHAIRPGCPPRAERDARTHGGRTPSRDRPEPPQRGEHCRGRRGGQAGRRSQPGTIRTVGSEEVRQHRLPVLSEPWKPTLLGGRRHPLRRQSPREVRAETRRLQPLRSLPNVPGPTRSWTWARRSTP